MPTLELLEVDAAVTGLQGISGKGSQAARREALSELFSRATEPEQRLLVGLFLGELRQGALEGVMIDAVARAAGLPVGDVRRAAMLAGDLRTVAAVAMGEGAAGLARFRLTPLHAVTPMLAQTADDISSALGRLGRASIEWKLDGARIQAHRAGGEVRLFTRNLADITDRVPEIAAAVRELDVDAIVLDGEAIALRADGRPEPFQVTMSRFGTKTAAAGSRLSVRSSSTASTSTASTSSTLLHASGSSHSRRVSRRSWSFRGWRPTIRLSRNRFSTTRSLAATRASW